MDSGVDGQQIDCGSTFWIKVSFKQGDVDVVLCLHMCKKIYLQPITLCFTKHPFIWLESLFDLS